MQGNILCQSGGNYGQPTITITDLGVADFDTEENSSKTISSSLNMHQLTNEYSYGTQRYYFYQYNINTNTLVKHYSENLSNYSTSSQHQVLPSSNSNEFIIKIDNNYYLYNLTDDTVTQFSPSYGLINIYTSMCGAFQLLNDNKILIADQVGYRYFNTAIIQDSTIAYDTYYTYTSVHKSYYNVCCTRYGVYAVTTDAAYMRFCAMYCNVNNYEITNSYCPCAYVNYLYSTNKYAVLIVNGAYNNSVVKGYIIHILDMEHNRWYSPVFIDDNDIFPNYTTQFGKTDNSFIIFNASSCSAVKVTIDI